MRLFLPTLLATLAAPLPALAQEVKPPIVEELNIEDRALLLMDAGKESEALALIRWGAEQGDPLAINYLAWFYENGRAVNQDMKRATRLYRQAASLGNPYSKWRLGVLIDTEETKGTLEEAVALFREAAELGSSNAWTSLGVMYATGRGTPVDYTQARASYQKAAELGNSHGFQGLGVIYGNGEGVDVDATKALAYWLVAKAMDNETATEKFDRFIPGFDDDEQAAIFDEAKTIAAKYALNLDLRAAMKVDSKEAS